MYIPRLAVFSAAAALLFTPVSVSHASDKGTFSATLGAAASFSPDYEGSDDYGVGGIPFLSLGWHTKPDVPSGGSGLQFGLHDAKLNLPGSLEETLSSRRGLRRKHRRRLQRRTRSR